MKTPEEGRARSLNPRRSSRVAAGVVTAALGLAGCGHIGMMLGGSDVEPPPTGEFGLGPRTSAGGGYEATLEPTEPLQTRHLHTVLLRVTDREGAPVDGATIEVDGGMPQHGHGLPTRPRVTRALDDGRYEIDGLKFNMGGWWELRLRITRGATTDSVTFNLDL